MGFSVLIVDDEPEIADLVEVYLLSEGYTVHKFYTAREALQCVRTTPLDLAILDVMLPEMNGFALCAEIRKEYNFPVIMLTAKVEATDKITGLTIGADDYITKPFNPLEMVARVKAQLRRYTRYNENEKTGGSVIDFDGLVINRNTHECTLFDEPLSLTPIEFSILWLLCSNRGQVISSEQLFERVWGEKYLDRNNTVMVHIRRLREKMGEPSRNPRFIKTVWGVGYKIE
ncbi:VanR-ABDEGLN family response regulator transcription factor [Papillibacter cinnamivorans]|uniref:Stage 0 sporulation protein A homolog n=1 Tax=Papillibacter cinnamivorans DSM 12816 TaxID=1122930 RepID=A0A1W2A4K7_9FIRM|nr:VanR-ABDEGLN family response regulator transcription factor [Papillibacter cinnamivorans]SMC55513.1 two-component system, OmpR family, response regulator VanR [Papillibacter cinnamivorans DSM 12816]